MEPGKGIWLLLLLTLSPLLWGQYYSSGSKKAMKRFEEARDCLKQRDLVCAEEALQKAIKADDQFIEAYQLLAQLSYDRGEMDQAICYYARTLEIDPIGNPEGYRLLSDEPQRGAHDCLVCFIHPKSAGGVLIELSQPAG